MKNTKLTGRTDNIITNTEKPQYIKKTFAILVSQYHRDITHPMYLRCSEVLLNHGVKKGNIFFFSIPGAFELPFAAKKIALLNKIDVVICIGCLIRGETKHFDFIASAVCNGLTEVSLLCEKPVIFGVLTTENFLQAKQRIQGDHADKGVEIALSALQMSCFPS